MISARVWNFLGSKRRLINTWLQPGAVRRKTGLSRLNGFFGCLRGPRRLKRRVNKSRRLQAALLQARERFADHPIPEMALSHAQ